MRRSVAYRVIGIAVVAAAAVAAGLLFLRPALRAEDVLAAYDERAEHSGLAVKYPLDGTLFPPEIPPPTFRWADSRLQSGAWLVTLQFQDGGSRLNSLTRATEWTPSDRQWEAIKRRSLEKDVKVTVIGVMPGPPCKVISAATFAIRTSSDEVGAPLFYREVNLPFEEAVKDPSLIRWRFGSVSSEAPPPIVLKGLPVCGNCHSF
jgi:hypothetical protein